MKELNFSDVNLFVEWIPSPNFSKRGSPIDMIVIHYTATMTLKSPLCWLRNLDGNEKPLKVPSQVSAHYLIGRDGRTIQLVKDQDKAWHSGYSYYRGEYNLNKNSIGIELVATDKSGFTDIQYESLTKLCAVLISKYEIPEERIVGHEHISGEKVKEILMKKYKKFPGKIDPGKLFEWDTFKSKLFDILYSKDVIDMPDTEPYDVLENDIENGINAIEIYGPQKDMSVGVTGIEGTLLEKIIDFLLGLFKRY